MTIPEGWETRKLECIASITSGATPKVGNTRYYGGTIPFLKIDDLSQNSGLYLNQAKTTITEAALKETAAKLYPTGTVLVTMYGTIGCVGILNTPMSANQAIAAFLDLRSINKDFLAYLLSNEATRLQRQAGQTTQANISGHILRRHSVLLPPLPEQKKIAAILSSVDETIQATRETIEQTKKVKKGLMQELLPVGKSKHPEVLLDDVTARGTGHTPDRKHPEYWNGGVKWISLSDCSALDNVYIKKSCKEISVEGLQNSSAVLHPAGTVILSRDAGVGKSAILREPMAVSQHFIAWRCSTLLSPLYLYYWLQSNKMTFERIALGSTIKTIGMPFFRKLRIPLPPLLEQESIANTLHQLDAALKSLEAVQEQHQHLKKGLMQNLLTGQVRVAV